VTPGRIWLALAAAVATGCAQPGQTALPESDANAIRQAEKALVASMSDPDPTAWVKFYAHDAVFLPPNEPAVQGREALVNYAKTFPPPCPLSH
jgi:transport factor 2 (NTF2)-like protein